MSPTRMWIMTPRNDEKRPRRATLSKAAVDEAAILSAASCNTAVGQAGWLPKNAWLTTTARVDEISTARCMQKSTFADVLDRHGRGRTPTLRARAADRRRDGAAGRAACSTPLHAAPRRHFFGRGVRASRSSLTACSPCAGKRARALARTVGGARAGSSSDEAAAGARTDGKAAAGRRRRRRSAGGQEGAHRGCGCKGAAATSRAPVRGPAARGSACDHLGAARRGPGSANPARGLRARARSARDPRRRRPCGR